jgi:tetratricopeptide (TPR) repeat protein
LAPIKPEAPVTKQFIGAACFTHCRKASTLDLTPFLAEFLDIRMPREEVKRKKLTPRKRRELDVQIDFLEALVRRDPKYLEALQLLGDSYTERGRHRESLNVDRRLVRKEPQNPVAYYNLACSYALNGRVDRAVAALEHAIHLGYRDFRWIARDPDLRELRKHPRYRRIKEKICGMLVHIC